MKDSYFLPERLFWTAYLAASTRGQREVPFWPPDRLARVQSRRIRNIVRFASSRVPYYRDLCKASGLEPEDFRSVEDLSRFPILDPLEIRKAPARFRPDNRNVDTLELVSSGTTGVPRRIAHDAVSLFTNAAHGERIRFFYPSGKDGSRNFREAMIVVPLGSSAEEVQHYNRKKAWFPNWARVERRYFSMLDDMDSLIKGINEFKPDVIRGYGSALNLIFEEVFRSGRELHLPRSLIYSADSMSPGIKRKVIEELKLPVHSIYSCVESLQVGFECGCNNGYHLNEDCYPVRIVDYQNRPLPEGVPGKVIISNLVNRANVILNYELGDEAMILPGKCECGRTQRRLSLNITRVADRLELENGSGIHPITFAEVVYYEKDLWQHQAVQTGKYEFDILLVTDPVADRPAMERRLMREFDKWFQGRIRVRIRFVDRIEVTSGGKQRALVLKRS